MTALSTLPCAACGKATRVLLVMPQGIQPHCLECADLLANDLLRAADAIRHSVTRIRSLDNGDGPWSTPADYAAKCHCSDALTPENKHCPAHGGELPPFSLTLSADAHGEDNVASPAVLPFLKPGGLAS